MMRKNMSKIEYFYINKSDKNNVLNNRKNKKDLKKIRLRNKEKSELPHVMAFTVQLRYECYKDRSIGYFVFTTNK